MNPAAFGTSDRPAAAAKPRARAGHRIGCVLLLCGLAGGCAIDQRQEVDLYRSKLDARVSPPPAYAPNDALTLGLALKLANANNEQLSSEGERYVQALIAKNRAAANFLPTVSFQPSYTIEQAARGRASTSTGPGGTGIGQGSTESGGTSSTNTGSTVSGGGFREVGQTFQRLEAPVVGNINLYRGGGDEANLQAAEATIEQRRQLLLDAQAAVLLNVAQVYYQVLRGEQAVQVLENSVKVQQARLDDVRRQFENELATRLAVAQSRAQVDATRASLIQARADVRNGRSTLAVLLGVDRVDGTLGDTFVAPRPDAEPSLADCEQQGVERREDLQAAAAAVRAARSAVDVAISRYYPSVSLNVSGFLYREFYSDASKWSAVLSANLPLFAAGLIKADVRDAWSRLRQAALFESRLRREIVRDVRIAYENFTAADEKVAAYEDQVAAAREALEQARNAVANNLAINLDVLVAQDQVLNAELSLTGVRFDRTIFYLDLLRSTGRLMTSEAFLADAPATQPVAAITAATWPRG